MGGKPSMDESLLVTERRSRSGGKNSHGFNTWTHTSLYILNWIFFSNVAILFNKWLLDTADFRYPIILTCWHLIFATFATQLLARTTTLLDSRHAIPLTGRLYFRTILPIAMLYTGSLVCSNLVYLYLSVAFTQMLKSAAPVVVLFVSWAFGVAEPSLAKLLNVVFIVVGIAIASFGEINFSLFGFLCQVGGIVFEALRLVMIQVMLSGEGVKMDPLVGLYYYAPVCATFNFLVALYTEVPSFDFNNLLNTGFSVLFLNALVAFALNVASVFLIGKTSGLVLTLTGIFKSILLVAVSLVIWQSPVSLTQAVGYTIAMLGLAYYSLGYDQVVKLYSAASAWATAAFGSYCVLGSSPNGGYRGSFLPKRYIVVGSACIMSLLFVVAFMFGD